MRAQRGGAEQALLDLSEAREVSAQGIKECRVRLDPQGCGPVFCSDQVRWPSVCTGLLVGRKGSVSTHLLQRFQLYFSRLLQNSGGLWIFVISI